MSTSTITKPAGKLAAWFQQFEKDPRRAVAGLFKKAAEYPRRYIENAYLFHLFFTGAVMGFISSQGATGGNRITTTLSAFAISILGNSFGASKSVRLADKGKNINSYLLAAATVPYSLMVGLITGEVAQYRSATELAAKKQEEVIQTSVQQAGTSLLNPSREKITLDSLSQASLGQGSSVLIIAPIDKLPKKGVIVTLSPNHVHKIGFYQPAPTPVGMYEATLSIQVKDCRYYVFPIPKSFPQNIANQFNQNGLTVTPVPQPVLTRK